MTEKPTYEELEQQILELQKADFERKQIEESREKSESQLREIIDLVPHFIFVKDETGKFEIVNKATAEVFGTTVEDLTGRRDAEFVATDEEMEDFRADDLEVIHSGIKKFIPEEPITDSENNIRYLQTTKVPFKFSATKKPSLLGVAVDITELKLKEQAIREKTELLKSILDSAKAVGIITTDLDFHITYYNLIAKKFFGYTPDEVIGRSVIEIHTEKGVDKGRFENAIKTVQRDGIFRYSLMQDTKEGKCELDLTVSGIMDSDDKLTGYSLFTYDVTERRQFQREREQLRLAIEQVADTVVITDIEGTIQYVNPTFEKTTGYKYDEAIGQNPRILKGGKQDEAFYKEMWATLMGGETWRGRLLNKKKDGTLYTEEATISPIKDASGDTINFVAVKRDVTKEESLEKQLRHAMKMEAIGTLAGGIAHDFNNILTAILGYSEMAKGQLPAADPIREDLDQVIQAGNRATELVKQILTFSSQGEEDFKPLKVQLILKEVLKLLRSSMPTTIQLKEAITANSGSILADPTQIHQVLMNLCINAKHAIADEPGTISISLSEIQVSEEKTIDNGPQIKPGTYLDLEINDTGCGMDESTRSKIFDPFFTTKEKSKGTGLGLSVVHGIIKQHKGEITVASVQKQGTTFHIYLPVIEKELLDQHVISEDIPRGNGEQILFVDDETVIAHMMQRTLESLGYTVTIFTSSIEALNVYQKNPDDFNLVITDMTMPEMTGVELTRNLLTIRPDLSVILCTGFSEVIDENMAKSFGISEYLRKPVDKLTLAKAIKSALRC